MELVLVELEPGPVETHKLVVRQYRLDSSGADAGGDGDDPCGEASDVLKSR
jgi:hypothetical protein